MNKQEFSASSWRSNQGYTKMHGQPTIKIIDDCCHVKSIIHLKQYDYLNNTLRFSSDSIVSTQSPLHRGIG